MYEHEGDANADWVSRAHGWFWSETGHLNVQEVDTREGHRRRGHALKLLVELVDCTGATEVDAVRTSEESELLFARLAEALPEVRVLNIDLG